MDFPKSVPNVGLVNGRFVDEDPSTELVGSLVPAAWGNALTDEILNVIESQGLTPTEGDNTQLRAAILKIILDRVPPSFEQATPDKLGLVALANQVEAEEGSDALKSSAPLRVLQAFRKLVVLCSETVVGLARKATQGEVDGGVNDSAFITPKTLLFGIRRVSGGFALPARWGGFIFQLVRVENLLVQTSVTLNLPMSITQHMGTWTSMEGDPGGLRQGGAIYTETSSETVSVLYSSGLFNEGQTKNIAVLVVGR